jgi:NTP-dependent ternary system trypsin peptidase co-occuring protein
MPVTTVLVNNQTILFEVEDRHIPTETEAQGQLEGTDAIITRASDLGTFIKDACVQLYTSVAEATSAIKPSQVELSFGVTLGGEAGIPFVAKGSAQANVSITLTWNPGRGSEDDKGQASV